MLAIQAPSASTLMPPARRDKPRPTAMVRSASAPRPKISRLPSATFTTSPDGVLTCAVTEVAGWMGMGWSLTSADRGGSARAQLLTFGWWVGTTVRSRVLFRLRGGGEDPPAVTVPDRSTRRLGGPTREIAWLSYRGHDPGGA